MNEKAKELIQEARKETLFMMNHITHDRQGQLEFKRVIFDYLDAIDAALDEKPESTSKHSVPPTYYDGRPEIEILKSKIDRLEAELANMRTYSHETVRGLVDHRDETIKQLVRDSNRSVLAKFVREVIRRYCWDLGEVDGGDLQDLAVGFGLLKEHKVLESEAEKYPDSVIGDVIYVFSETLQENDKQYPSNFGEENNNEQI